MTLVLMLVFLAVFAVVALLLTAAGVGAASEAKRTLGVLDAALSTGKRRRQHMDPIVDVRKTELLSAVPLLNRLLLKMELAPRLRQLLYQAQVQWTVGVLVLMMAAGFFIPLWVIHLMTRSALIGLLGGILIGAAPLVYVLAKRRTRFNKFEKQLPEALDLMVTALRAGHSLNSALGLVAEELSDPIGGEVRICFDEQNYGLELKTAMNNLTYRVPLQDLKMVSTAILIQKDSGGNLAEVLDKVAYVIRERFRLKRQVRTHTAQGRMTGWVLTLLPVILGFALYMIDPKEISVLWHHSIGIKLMYAAVILMFIGALIIRKIVNMEV